MGARLALAKATVTTPTGEVFKDHTVHVVGQRLQVSLRGQTVLSTDGVDRADRTAQRVWTLTMTDGTRWTVERGKGCNCGGR